MTSNSYGSPLLLLRGVRKAFSAADIEVLHEVSLAIDPGEFVAIVGPSGSGKSTLLNILGLLDAPTSGTFLLDGRDVSALTERDRNRLRSSYLGFVFQSSHAIGHETVARNAAFSMMVKGLPRRTRLTEVTRLLKEFGLFHRSDALAKNLSGGERQRLALARAIGTAPQILLADEPTGNLDSENSRIVVNYLKHLNQSGTAIVLITHDEEVAAIADRRVHMRDGVLDDERHPAVHACTRVDGRVAKENPPRADFKKALISLSDVLSDALTTITQTLARTTLLCLAFMLGVAGLVASIGVSESASVQIANRLNEAALDEVRVSQVSEPGGFVNPPSDWPYGSQEKLRALDGVKDVGVRSDLPSGSVHVSRLMPHPEQPSENVPVVVADGSLLALSECESFPTEIANQLDNEGTTKLALIGESAAQRLNISWKATGNTVWLAGEPVSIVGIVRECPRDPALISSIIVSGKTLSLDPSSMSLVVRTVAGYPAPLSDAVPLVLRPENPAAIKVSTVADLRALSRGISTDLGTLLAGISGILFLLSILSGGTSMYLSVRSRRSEIALRRALGASRWAVARVFLAEGLLLGAGGGLAGSAVGMITVLVACFVQGWTPVLSAMWIPLGLLLGCGTGIASAIYPSLIAARESPAEAIRGD